MTVAVPSDVVDAAAETDCGAAGVMTPPHLRARYSSTVRRCVAVSDPLSPMTSGTLPAQNWTGVDAPWAPIHRWWVPVELASVAVAPDVPRFQIEYDVPPVQVATVTLCAVLPGQAVVWAVLLPWVSAVARPQLRIRRWL